MHAKGLAVLIVVLIIYVILGGVGFHFLEEPAEREAQGNINEYLLQFQDDFQCVSREDVLNFLHEVKLAYDSGILAPNSTTNSNWEMRSAIFFAVTVVTTIGYGHIAPITVGGRMFCVFFALFGIPAFLVAAAAVGNKLNKGIQKIQTKAACKSLSDKPKVVKTLTSILVLSIGLTLFMLIPSVIFYVVEDWGFYESVYYAFITLTTIGFGDFVAGTTVDEAYAGWYRLCVAFWIFIGLAWMAGVISTVQETFSTLAEKADNKIQDKFDKKGEEPESSSSTEKEEKV